MLAFIYLFSSLLTLSSLKPSYRIYFDKIEKTASKIKNTSLDKNLIRNSSDLVIE